MKGPQVVNVKLFSPLLLLQKALGGFANKVAIDRPNFSQIADMDAFWQAVGCLWSQLLSTYCTFGSLSSVDGSKRLSVQQKFET